MIFGFRAACPHVKSLPVALLFALGLAWSGSAQAQQQPSAAAMAAAKELIEIKGASHMFDPVVPGVIETAKNVILRTSPNLAKDLNDVAAQLRNEYANKKLEITNLIARIYAQHFTEAEIKQALAFYKTPLGQKLIQQEPVVLEQSMSQVQSWGENFQEEIMARFRAEMTKRGHKM
ncbi:MAG TPA: DUF2059 domain-containing protein [Xanthobacteraceae bacterium]|nr:DUF2059 domain-containing protein [Xanthobacteraceae bacterium]